MYWRKRKFFTTFFFVFGLLIFQAQISDDFSDGDYTSNPTWSGDASLFIINASNELQSQSPGAATYYLSTPSTLALDAEWEFYINTKFATSGANYIDVFLASDNAILTSANNGYFVRFGNTTDEISLYKKVGGTNTILIDGVDALISSSSNNPFKIKVTRDVSNNWTLMYDKGVTGSYTTAGTVIDNSVSVSTHFGILIVQSTAASAVNNHFFDDVLVQPTPVDTTPPTLISATPISNNQLDALFDESVDLTTAQTNANYFVNGSIGNPSSAIIDGSNPALVHLSFTNTFANGQSYTVTATNIQDLVGNNQTSTTANFTYFVPDIPTNKAVVINEIFADPSPVVGLPEAEFVELFNATTDKYFDLSGWTFSDGSSTATLPANTYLFPGEYIVLCSSSDVTLFSAYPNVLGVGSFPSLNNSGDNLVLTDNLSNVIDQVNYSDTWYQNSTKKAGGYTLELINPFAPCSDASNWIGSNDASGGTPSKQNSVYDNTPDAEAPTIIFSLVLDNQNLQIDFSESIIVGDLTLSDFSVSGGISVSSFTSLNTENTSINISFSTPIDTGVVYLLTINNVKDCSENISTNNAEFILPFKARIGDLIINEILFDPYVGGYDFVELYNNSDRTIDIHGMFLANEENGEVDNFKPIEIHRLVKPTEFIVLTEDSTNIKANYLGSVIGTFIETDLPTYANDKGVVIIALPDSTVSDRFAYTDDMHFKLIKDVEGKSLERIDYNRSSDDETNWHTAAENVGFATPGKENSQFTEIENIGDVTLSPEIFSPDNDGYEDVITFSYKFSQEGFVGNAYVYDSEGRMIKYLIQNQLLGTKGQFSWDGISDRGEKGRIGTYIFIFEVFNLSGDVNTYKKTFVLGGKL